MRSILRNLISSVASVLWPTTSKDLRSDMLPVEDSEEYANNRKSLINSIRSKIDTNNTYGPYLKTYSDKALKPMSDALNKLYSKVSDGFGFIEPSTWANTRAGDDNYVATQQKQVLDYLKDPKNGWSDDGNGVFINNTTGQRYDSDVASRAASAVVGYYKGENVYPKYLGDKRLINIPSVREGHHIDLDKAVHADSEGVLKQTGEDKIHPMSSSSPSTLLTMSPDKLDKYNDTSSAAHEVNHAMTAPVTAAGLFTVLGEILDKGDSKDLGYATNTVELHNAASLFQQNHFNLHGERLTNKDTMLEDLDNAKDNIEDYDPESRRFLQSVDILENEAKTDDNAADMLNQVVEAMPLITQNTHIPGYDKDYTQTLES